MPPPARHVVVRPGQSLRGIAHAYHVAERQLIASNHLRPPYKLWTGQRLTIPDGGAAEPVTRTAALPPLTVVPARPLPEAVDAPASSLPPAGGASANVIPLDDPGPARGTIAARSPATLPARSTAAAHPPATLSPPIATARSPGEPSAAEAARAEANAAPTAPSAAHGGRFSWPVRGRVLAAYGAASGGTRNDGINIAAPRGAPVSAVEGGEVAYAGNELKGYGNLVLIKHPDGYITAYAHCDELLVKRGEKVGRGQVIAKVGTTGGVSEPQLHFELRRGKQPVDPKEFLAPAPSAEASDPPRKG
jgi:murein DD-endopeptidase MepM/ murein hydrolase activator NlpD